MYWSMLTPFVVDMDMVSGISATVKLCNTQALIETNRTS